MLQNIPNGYFNSYEGEILMEVQFYWRKRDRLKLFFFGESEIDRMLGPPYRFIKIVRSGLFWNFDLKKFTDYEEKSCKRMIHRSEETNFNNFFNVYERNYEKSPIS